MARPGLRIHPKFKRLVALLRMPEAHVLGHLEMIWETAYELGDVLGDALDVEITAGWVGEPGALCNALATCGGVRKGFIEEIPESQGIFKVHDLLDHAPQYVQKRMERESERIQKNLSISEIRRNAVNKRWAKAPESIQMDTSEIHLNPEPIQTDTNGCTPSPSPSPIETTTPLPPAPQGELPLDDAPPPARTSNKPRKPAKPRGRDFSIGTLDLPEPLVDQFDRVWAGWPKQGWNYSTKSLSPRRLQREQSLARFGEIIRFSKIAKADGTQLTEEELADAALAWVGKRIRESPGAPCVPCIGNFFSSVAGEKNPWKDAVLEFFTLAEVS